MMGFLDKSSNIIRYIDDIFKTLVSSQEDIMPMEGAEQAISISDVQ